MDRDDVNRKLVTVGKMTDKLADLEFHDQQGEHTVLAPNKNTKLQHTSRHYSFDKAGMHDLSDHAGNMGTTNQMRSQYIDKCALVPSSLLHNRSDIGMAYHGHIYAHNQVEEDQQLEDALQESLQIR